MVKCPDCGKELPDDSRFCPYCRSAITPEMVQATGEKRCPVCNAPVDADARFCTNCRSPLSAIPAAPPAPSSACPKCGARLPEHAAFCVSCGQPISTFATEPQEGRSERMAGVSSIGSAVRVGTPGHLTSNRPAPPSEAELSRSSTTRVKPSETTPSTEIRVTTKGSSIPSTAHEREKAPEAPASSLPVPQKPLLKAWWVWVFAAAIVAGFGAYMIPRYLPRPVPANASILVDNFTGDQALNSGLWVINGPTGNAVGPGLTSPASALARPTLTFSSQRGLGIGGVEESSQLATIETAASFDPPFTVNTNIMPTVRNGSGFGLIVSDGSGQNGVGITGHLDSAVGRAEIDYIVPEAGAGWKSQGVLCRSLQANTWYSLSVFFDAQGSATLTFRAGPQTVGEKTVHIGKGPFHIILVQEGGGKTVTDHGQVSWQSVKVFSGTTALPVQPGERPKPATTNAGSQVAIRTPSSILQPPVIQNAVIMPGRTSLRLPPGRSLYLYGMVTGGAAPSSGFARGHYAQVADAARQVAVALAATPDNTNSFTTGTAYFVIGGVAVSRYSHYAASYGSNGAPGASSASDTFALSQNSVVVIIGLASSQQGISLTGIPGLKTEALSSGRDASEGMIIAHAYLPRGVYTVTEHSRALVGGQDANHMADLIGVFAFEPKD
jgi:Double zinc ribbon/zinc-ribbon domain